MSRIRIVDISEPNIVPIITYIEPKDCIEAAAIRKLPLSKLLKSILLEDKGGKLFLACILAHRKIDLKKFQLLLNCRRLSFAPESKVIEITGCPIGAVTPYADCVVVYDVSVSEEKDYVNISAGDKKVSYNINPGELIKEVNPIIADIGG